MSSCNTNEARRQESSRLRNTGRGGDNTARFDQKQWLGRINYALLLTMYNTGARVSEIITLRQHQFTLGSKGQVHLCGKGRKERLLPLWSRTALVLKSWFAELTLTGMAFAFPSQQGEFLTRFALHLLLQKSVKEA